MTFFKFAPIFLGLSLFAADRTVEGRWRLDLGASNVRGPVLSETLLFEKSGTKFRLTADSAQPNRTDKLILPCDGKVHTENNAAGAYCKIKDHGTRILMRSAGADVSGNLSPDGNSFLITRMVPDGTETLLYRRE